MVRGAAALAAVLVLCLILGPVQAAFGGSLASEPKRDGVPASAASAPAERSGLTPSQTLALASMGHPDARYGELSPQDRQLIVVGAVCFVAIIVVVAVAVD